MIDFLLDGRTISRAARRNHPAGGRPPRRRRSRAFATRTACGPTATAAPASWRSTASARWRRRAAARPRRAWWSRPRARARGIRKSWCSSCCAPTCRARPTARIPSSISGPPRSQVGKPRFAPRLSPGPDTSHPAIAVNLDACIQCTRCVRACREEQVNDVIGYAFRGHHSEIVFDLGDPMGESTCVACGECVQACPTGALSPARGVGQSRGRPDRRFGVSVLRRRLPAHLPHQGRRDPARRGPRRPRQPEPAVRQGTLRLRLRPPSPAADEAADPAGRRAQVGRLHDGSGRRRTACSAKRAGKRRSRSPAAGCARFATPKARMRCPASAPPRAATRRPTCSRSWCAPAFAPTTSITARASATHPASPRCWRESARARCRTR